MNDLERTEILKKSLQHIRRLKQALKASAASEPVAIIGAACRFPGGSDTPEKFWELLKNGREGLRDVPPGRWDAETYFDEEPGKPLKIYTRQLNFLAEDVSLFDSRLFVISPREAEEMDPQQRLLLELTWEALERSGHAPKALKGQPVGVFMGIITSEYGLLPRDMTTTGPHTMTGLLNSMAAGRIAHAFGFHGPALSIDTACSSSLVSIHEACKSIRDNECHTAIAGGAGLMLSPVPMINLCKLHALSKDGRCKTFSANGDGYGRGEGAGVVVLKRLDMAQRDGDPILAVIETSNLNHDGPSSGLTVPNGQAQRRLLEETLNRAGIQPGDIGYVEMHGTGTSLGDPIEFQSLVEVFGQDGRRDKPLMLGTCKANIGHLEAAAGIASVIKTVLCLQHKAVPPHINCDEINPRIQLQRIPAMLPGAYRPWQTRGNETRRVAISSFGFSGTNAFMVIKEPPARPANASPASPSPANPSKAGRDRQQHILTVSAQSRSALKALVERYRQYVSDPAVTDLPSFAYTVNVGRSHFGWRAACVWADKEALLSCLSDIEAERRSGGNTRYPGSAVEAEKKVSIVFPGKLDGAFNELLPLIESCPYFEQEWKQCEAVLSAYTSSPLTHLIGKNKAHFLALPLDEAAIVFSAAYAMFALFRHLGIKVSTVYGEGEGVLAMAASTGMVSLEQAVSGLVRRYLDNQPREPLAKGYQFNMPRFRVILPGSKAPLKRSQLSDPTLLECAYSEPDGRGDIRELLGGDDALVLELDTRPGVSSQLYGRDMSDCSTSYLTTMSWDGVVNVVAECYSHGHSIDWQRFDEGFQREKLVCPTYPFQRRSYWIKTTPGLLNQGRNPPPPDADAAPGNPLTGRVQPSPLNVSQVLFNIGPEQLPSLIDTHYIVHIGLFFEMLASGLTQLGSTGIHIRYLTFDAALIVPEGGENEIHLMLEAPSDGSANFSFHTAGKHRGDWTQHVHGALSDAPLSHSEPGGQAFASIKSRCPDEMSGEAFYQTMTKRGFVLGPSVRWIDQVWYRDGEALARFRLATADERSCTYGLTVHPGVWASCFQLLHATLEKTVGFGVRFVLVGMGAIDFFRSEAGPTVWCHVTSPGRPNDEGVLDGAFTLYTDAGEVIAYCQSCEMKEQAVDKEDRDAPCEGNPEIVRALNEAPSPDRQLGLIVGHVKRILSELLKVPGDEIVATESINLLGMDSLVGFELRDKIHKEFGVPVPIPTLLQGPTPGELAEAVQRDFKVNRNVEAAADRDESAADSGEIVIPAYSSVSLEKHKWVQGNRRKGAVIDLYCLPYGGGGASLYRGWEAAFPADVSVHPIQLPGRQDRILEHPIESIHDMVKTLTDVLGGDLGRPYAVYGHSAGALVGYAWARYLQECGAPTPECLLVGGFTAPFISSPYLGVIKNVFRECGFERIPSVDDLMQRMNEAPDKIRECMTRVAGVTGIGRHQAFERPAFSDAMLPQLVADTRLVESFDSQSAARLNLPIAALHGMEDDRVTLMGMHAWKSLTNDSFSFKAFPGDHFFLHADQSGEAVTNFIYDFLVTHRQEAALESG